MYKPSMNIFLLVLIKLKRLLIKFFKKHKICIDFGLPNCNSVEKKAILMQYLYDLDSLIFEEYEIRLKSMEKLRDQSSSMMNTEYQAFQKSYTKLKSQLIDVYS